MKICIVKLSAMGDIIHSMVGLQYIKKIFPNAQIDWVVEESFKGILENNPHIDNILPINLKSIKKKRLEIFKQIKLLNSYSKNNYDIVLDLQGLLKSAIASKIIGDKIVNSFIIGFDKNSIRESIASLFYDKKVNISYSENTIIRNLKVIEKALDIEITEKDILEKESFLFYKKRDNQDKNLNKIVFVVGASKLNKIYPKEKFLELAILLNQEILVVWGNKDEYEIAEWLHQKSNLIDIAPKSNLDDLKFLISKSKLVIGGDTGPTHIAWGLNIPSITIFGNTPADRNTYLTDINRVIKSDSIVNPLKLDKNDFSIQNIQPKNIFNIAKKLLDKL